MKDKALNFHLLTLEILTSAYRVEKQGNESDLLLVPFSFSLSLR